MRRMIGFGRSLCRSLGIVAAAACLHAQVNPSGTLTGTVLDPSGAAVVTATVQVTDEATNRTFRVQVGSDGRFFVGNLPPGNYTVEVSASGFQRALFQHVRVIVGQTYDLKVVLRLSGVTSTVTVEAGQQVLDTAQASVSTVITGEAITHLPLNFNEPLGLALYEPSAQTTGAPRNTTFSGLPNGVINITLDGINAQYPGKSTDGFYTLIRAHIDDIQEMNITTAANAVSDTGEGAVQMSFVSQRGTNDWHGGVWEYFRNDWLNSNYYFNNLAGTPRQRMRYNQFGFKLGGPVLKNRLFFFADLDWYKFPVTVSRTRTILNAQASQGLFTYPVNQLPANPPPWLSCSGATMTCTANLLALAANYGGTAQIDTLVGQTLAALQKAVTAPGVRQLAPPSLYQQAITFNNPGGYDWRFPDVRLDWNVSPAHALEFDYHYGFYAQSPNVFNNGDQTFPVAPFNRNLGSYYANRNMFVWAWRWTIGTSRSNELRFGFQSPPESFLPDLNLSIYPQAQTNLGTVRIRPVLGPTSGNILMDQPWRAYQPSRDTYAMGQLIDNYLWVRGAHSLAFGFTVTRQAPHLADYSAAVANVQLGMVPTDPMAANFNNSTLPGITAADLATAQQLYGVLTGRIIGYSGQVNFDPDSRQFVTGHPNTDHWHSTDFGIYAADSWRVRPSLTMNYGLRWQYEGVPVDELNKYFTVQGGYAGLFGVSGLNHLFQPGVLTGSTPVFVLNGDRPWYHNWYKGFAPSLGLAWQPGFSHRFWQWLFGAPGQSVFRAGYSVAYSREGLFAWSGIVQRNPGWSGVQFTTPVSPNGPIGPGQFAAGSLRLQDLMIPTLAQSPSQFTNSFPINPTASQQVALFDPNLHMPYVQSWTVGVQRALGQKMAVEVRYVGNHAVGLWQTLNLNEVNIFENGFLKEFINAASNLAICRTNATACLAAQAAAGVPSSQQTVNNFADWGLPGQSALPVFTAAFTGSTNAGAGAPTQTNANFRSGSFVSLLGTGQAGSVANLLTGFSYWQNLLLAGYPRNFWVVNPDATGGAYLFRNGFQSTYNALVVNVRRRLSRGLMFDVSYAFSKSLTNGAVYFASSNTSYSNSYFNTLRAPRLSRGPTPFDMRHAVKLQALWELPFGPGHWLQARNAWLNRILGGWQLNALGRYQSGTPFLLVGGLGGTYNQNDGGVVLHGITASQLQNQLGIYKTPTPAPGAVWYFPPSLLGPNMQRANPAVLSACTTPGVMCPNVFIYGPAFLRTDLAVQKTTPITERVKLELRFEFLNAFNNANFMYTNRTLQSPLFGQITTAYSDFNGTADPGGRVIQLVGRINF